MTVGEYLEQLLDYLGIEDAKATIEETEEYCFVDLSIPEEDAGKMIGAHGETINSLRQLIFLSFSEYLGDKKVVVNVNDYKDKKEDAAREIGFTAAERAIDTQRPQHLPKYLLAHQRRAVHQELDEYNGVFTRSEGEGEDRHLVVYPDSYREQFAGSDEK